MAFGKLSFLYLGGVRMDYEKLAREYEQEAEQVKKRLDDIRGTMTKSEWERSCRTGRVSTLREMYLSLKCTARTLRERAGCEIN